MKKEVKSVKGIKEIKKTILKKVYKKRKPWAHKDDFGRLLIIGGSKRYSGSPSFNALAAMAAYRSGVDIVEVVAPERVANIIASFSPDMITYPLEGNYVAKKHLKTLLEESKNKTAFVIGGGLERNTETLYVVREFLRKIKIPGVIDADAIYAIGPRMDLSNFVFTPHAYEFFVLTGKKLKRNLALKEKIKIIWSEAKKLNTTILLKGNVDIISDGKQIAINKTGTPYMTVGGTGDTLAGILGSLIAQKNSLFDSACAAAYINGKAGELTQRKASLTATDLIEKISEIVDKAG